MDKYRVRTDLATEIIKDSGLVEEEKNINGIYLIFIKMMKILIMNIMRH